MILIAWLWLRHKWRKMWEPKPVKVRAAARSTICPTCAGYDSSCPGCHGAVFV